MRSEDWRRHAGWLALAAVIGVAGCASEGSKGPGQSAGAYVDDSMITAKVKTAFVEDKDVSALNIGVTTSKGVVQLTGEGTPAEARRAGEIARSVSGVKAVQNNIRAK
jgi:hyperosmotically inducible protein